MTKIILFISIFVITRKIVIIKLTQKLLKEMKKLK